MNIIALMIYFLNKPFLLLPATLQAPAQAEESMVLADQDNEPDSDVEILDMEYEVTDNERNQVV